MKLLTYKFFLVIFYLLSTVISYSTELPDIKNLVVYSGGKKIKNIEFKNKFGEIIRLDDYRGKLVILNFWTTWCAPCRHEMTSLDTLQSMNQLKNLKIFPINAGKEKIEKTERFFLELNIENLDIYFDDNVKLANSFALIGLPTSIIINKNGEEFSRILGSIDFTDKKFIEWLSKYN